MKVALLMLTSLAFVFGPTQRGIDANVTHWAIKRFIHGAGPQNITIGYLRAYTPAGRTTVSSTRANPTSLEKRIA